jgi:hypothetical protein
MATTTNYGWAEPDNTSLVRNGAQDIRILGDAIDASVWNIGYGQAGKNKVINGAFQVWQRGTSVNTTTFGYTADRWLGYQYGSVTVSRQATSDTTNLPFIQYCGRVQRPSGQTGLNPIYLSQSLESAASIPLAGSSVTLSFYARKGSNYSSASSILSAQIISGTGTDQNVNVGGYTGAVQVAAPNVTLTTTWQRFTTTGTVGSTATQLGVVFTYTPVGTASTNDYFEITGVQLERGSTATPFQTASGGSPQAELAMCQRYYYRNSDSSTNYAPVCAAAITANATQSDAYIPLPVTMRTKPSSVDFSSLSIFDYVAASGYTISNVTINSNSSPTIAVASLTFATATSGRFIIVRGNNSASAYLGFSAEL